MQEKGGYYTFTKITFSKLREIPHSLHLVIVGGKKSRGKKTPKLWKGYYTSNELDGPVASLPE